MTDGTFRTWETVTAALGGVLLLFAMFYQDLTNGHVTRGADPKLLMIAIAVAAAGLFAKPVWLLGNWREIRTWERTTAFVRKRYTTGRGRRTRYHICLEFYSKDGKAHHKEIEGRTMFKMVDQNDIMFADEYMDALLFVPQAFRQAVGSAIAGVLLETVCVIYLLVL